MFIKELIKRHPIVLIYVLVITAYGVFCVWTLHGIIATYPHSIRILDLAFVDIVGIWLIWSGLNRLNNPSVRAIKTGRAFDRSIGYMKIMGGTALVAITHLFLIVIRLSL